MLGSVSNSPYRLQAAAQLRANLAAAAPQAAQPQPQPAVVVQAGGGFDAASILDTLMGMLKQVGSFFVGLWNKLLGKSTTPQAGTVDPNTQRIADYYHLFPSTENVAAFTAETQSYSQPGPGGFQTLGPGSPSTQAIQQLQQALASLGYQVPATGQYDAATQGAVKAFKQANGLHQSYKGADGNWAVNEYFDYQTYLKLSEKLSGGTTPAATTTQPAQPTSSTTTAAGTVNWQAIAQRYNLQPTAENVQAFLAEVATYQQTDSRGFRPLGPGYPNAGDIVQIQQALIKIGYAIQANGQWDAATSQAIIDYKRKNGLHQTYKGADGNWAINEYADFNTLDRLAKQVS